MGLHWWIFPGNDVRLLEICRLTRSLGLAIGEDSGIIAEPQVEQMQCGENLIHWIICIIIYRHHVNVKYTWTYMNHILSMKSVDRHFFKLRWWDGSKHVQTRNGGPALHKTSRRFRSPKSDMLVLETWSTSQDGHSEWQMVSIGVTLLGNHPVYLLVWCLDYFKCMDAYHYGYMIHDTWYHEVDPRRSLHSSLQGIQKHFSF